MKKPKLKSSKNIKKLSLNEKKAYLSNAERRVKNYRDNKSMENRLLNLKQTVRTL